MTLASDVAAKIIALGQGTALGTDIFAYRFPSSPINCVCIFLLHGYEPDEVQGSPSDGIDYPGFQIQARNTDVKAAAAKVEAIRLGLAGVAAGDYTVFAVNSGPMDMTNPDDLAANGGPAYRFKTDFSTIKPR